MVRASSRGSKCGGHCWFMNTQFMENRKTHISHIPLQPECRHGGLFSPTRPGHRRGQGSPFHIRAQCKRGTILAFSPSPGPEQQVRQRGSSARTVPLCHVALFLAPSHVSPTLGLSQKSREPLNYCPLIHPFLLKAARGISAVCSQKPCCRAPQRRKQRN